MFDYLLTKEQIRLRDEARDFVKWVPRDMVLDMDADKIKFPKEFLREAGRRNLFGCRYPKEWGGRGMDWVTTGAMLEEIGTLGYEFACVFGVGAELVCDAIILHGTDHLKEKYVRPLLRGEIFAAECLTEPRGGSDFFGATTKAEDRGDHYLLNGTKNWITNGGTSNVHLVMAQTHPELGPKGINALIVETSWPGVTIGAKEDKLGIRSSDTHTIMYTDVKVPKENRIGDDGFGFTFAMKTLAGGRIGIASQALGIAGGAYELAVAYSKERAAFGKPISQHQAIAFKLADMATKVEAAKLLVYKSALMKDQHLDYGMASSMAKVFASEAAMSISVEAVQVHGGYGYVKEYHVERLMRDAKITQIYEGTSEVQRIVISREVLKGKLYS